MDVKYFKNVFFILISTLWLNSVVTAQSTKVQRHIEVSMRMIGHQLLLNSGDSISRVLPIEKERDRYRIRFDSAFQFNPDKLVATIDSVIQKTEIANSYLVEVEECETGKVIYSYEIGDLTKTDVIPCGSRDQPEACYTVLISILDSGKSVMAGKKMSNSFIILLLILLLLIPAGLYFYFRKKKNIVETDMDKICIGKYEFDKKNMTIYFDNEKTELSGKETDLLFLLYSSANNTIERDVILKTVWGDEGDYIGRTLDVFISKLRKKLEADPEVKITNIRGVGYKLILNGIK
ncbi:MAG: winged helix-turn-helix domain-containing protein [Ferruginibacter sp.]